MRNKNILLISCEVLYSNQEGGFPTWHPIGIKMLTRNYDEYIRIHENSPIIYFLE